VKSCDQLTPTHLLMI